ncbi:flagellar motor switch protein FliM [Roseivivax lentus]|uniref:Flagellar motor switch protein FliM n=1 Tax=Roseivivax lentus TaxID=633194 RepID=A0A1N7PLP5_9RHOB|nr:flagellar motor switch protein FliM [Roseivivax lentus]SIT11299.1 flagellar motor switch protein FliM [Roseivivax lentus]
MHDAQDAETNDVLRRKASIGRRAFEAHGMSPEKALNRALARAAETHWNLALLARDVQQSRIDQASCEEALGEGGMIVLLDGPEGLPGFARIDGALVAGLTEVQTFGTISAMEPEDRPFTATDAAMTAPLLDQGLENFARLMAAHPLHRQIAEFRFGARVETARIAGTLMDSAFYTLFRLQVDLGGGCRSGQMMLAFPERDTAPAEDDAEADPAMPRHSQLMMTLPVHLDVVLCRLTLSLRDVEALQEGSRLALPRDALTRTKLCAAGGLSIAEGTLGQMNGQRALRLGGDALQGREAKSRMESLAATAMAGSGQAGAPSEPMAPLDFQQMVDAAEPSPSGQDSAPPGITPPLVDLPDIPELDDLPELPPLDLDNLPPMELPDLPGMAPQE